MHSTDGMCQAKTKILTLKDVPLVKFLYLVFTRMPGESYRRRFGSFLLCLCDVFGS